MFAELLEELLPTLRATKPQRDRVYRALSEADAYTYSEASADYQEPACRVTTLPGRRYLVFPNQCACEDWKPRCWGQIDEHGQEQACKHQIAWTITGNFPLPVEETPAPAGECPLLTQDYRDGSDWTQEEGEASAPDLYEREIHGIR